jgi:hypothetical protein
MAKNTHNEVPLVDKMGNDKTIVPCYVAHRNKMTPMGDYVKALRGNSMTVMSPKGNDKTATDHDKTVMALKGNGMIVMALKGNVLTVTSPKGNGMMAPEGNSMTVTAPKGNGMTVTSPKGNGMMAPEGNSMTVMAPKCNGTTVTTPKGNDMTAQKGSGVTAPRGNKTGPTGDETMAPMDQSMMGKQTHQRHQSSKHGEIGKAETNWKV